MPSLDDNTLDELRELNRLREQAKNLRKKGLAALRDLGKDKGEEAKTDPSHIKKNFDLSTKVWRSGPHPIDMALLVGVLNHRNIGESDAEAPKILQNILRDEISIEKLFPESSGGDENSDPVPVLTAARVLNTLMNRSETVFSRASMICYYRIIRELYTAQSPDWIIGAARGGTGGPASAFVTAECIRAILAFEKSIRDTITFFESTQRLVDEFKRIDAVPDKVPSDLKVDSNLKTHLEYLCTAKQSRFEQLALDWYVTNNSRRNVIALDLSELFPPEVVFDATSKLQTKTPRDFIWNTLQKLPKLLQETTKKALSEIKQAKAEVEKFRAEEAGVLKISEIETLIRLAAIKKRKNDRDSLSPDLVALIDGVREELKKIAKARRINPITEEQERKLKKIRDKFEAIFRQQVIVTPNARQTVKDKSPDRTLTWKLETNEGLVNLLEASKKGNSKASTISIGGDVLVNLNRLLLEYFFPELKPADPQRFNRTISAHAKALRVVFDAVREAETAQAELQDAIPENLSDTLKHRIEQYHRIRSNIHRVIDPAKQYIQSVLHRELAQASNPAKFDAGELLFAATSFGATSDWKDEQLDEARRLLIQALPNDGRMRTIRPVHSTSKGLRLIPISVEMTRSLAHLLQKDEGPDLDPKIVTRMLNIFEETIPIRDKADQIGWNFQSAPERNKPNVWVTSIAVLALDRIVRMLNERINVAIFKRFREERPRELGLRSLIYPDYELQLYFKPSNNSDYHETPHRFDGVSVGVRLQQMRAHLSRAILPKPYSHRSADKKNQRIYSAIFYGPPGTGKTTMAEALACTTELPLVRLSPGDLMVHGTDVVESRARVIFESLSMLSQTVIVLDEFEPVVRRRDSGSDSGNDPKRNPDPPEFRFLVTGMLPKLRALNKAAKEQSLVYCLGTNYLNEIDAAAKRAERFDLHIPIYHPDPISRCQQFLYQMVYLAEKIEKRQASVPSNKPLLAEFESRLGDKDFWLRIEHTISRTRNVTAQSLASDFFKLPKEFPQLEKDESLTNYVKRVLSGTFFEYVLATDMDEKTCPKPSEELVDTKMGEDQNGNNLTPVEIEIKKFFEEREKQWPKIA